MAQDFWEYAEQRRRECRELSLSDEELEFFEEEGSDGARGQIHGHITFPAEGRVAYLDVKEVVVIEGGHGTREEYAYFLVVDEIELWGQERDPHHVDGSVHYHTRKHDSRIPCEPVSFKAAVELAWEHLSRIMEDGFDDEYDPLA